MSDSKPFETPWLTAGVLSTFAAIWGTSVLVTPDASTPNPTQVVIGSHAVPSDDILEQHHTLRMREPLYDFAGIEPPSKDKPPLQRALGLPNVQESQLKSVLRKYKSEFLIMTVADPIDSVNNYFFDHQLDALQKALVANSNDIWLYNGGYLPWQAFKDNRSADNKIALKRHRHWYQDEPGVLVFRSDTTKRLLIVFLVGESPTLGIQRDAMTHAIREINELSAEYFDAPDSPQPIRIVGPTFTGGAHSLREALTLADAPATGFSLINGSATAIKCNYFSGVANLTYLGRTVCSLESSLNALTSAVDQLKMAWLVETGTELGSFDRNDFSYTIPVPVGISRVRGGFERTLKSARQQSIGLHLIDSTSSLPFDADEVARDVPQIQTPQMTTPSVERLLNHITHTITVNDIRFVGLLATDVRDTIFLAELIKLRCPQVQLLIPEPDILLAHPEYSDSLRGAIVASSYPLFPEGLIACRNASTDPLPAMSGQALYGIYNAVLMHRAMAQNRRNNAYKKEDNENRDDRTELKALCRVPLAGLVSDYGMGKPRVWLHTVGYDRLHPQELAPSPDRSHDLISIEKPEAEPLRLEFRIDWSWTAFLLCIVIAVAMTLLAWCKCNGMGDLFEPFRQRCKFGLDGWQTVAVWVFVFVSHGTLLLIAACFSYFLSCIWCGTAEKLPWLAEAHFFSGVSLLLPFFCSSVAVVCMCYMKIRQSHLVSTYRTAEHGATTPEQQRRWKLLWIASSTDFGTYKGFGWLLMGSFSLIWNIYVIFDYTFDTSGKPFLFGLTFAMIALGFVLWWLAAFELLVFQDRLRTRAKEMLDVRNGRHKPDKVVLKELHESGHRGLYRLLFQAGPHPGDLIARRASKHSFAESTWNSFREIQYRLVIIRNQTYLLVLGALFLFAASVAYPFTFAFMLKSFATLTALTLAGGVCLCYWKMETDESLSEMLGTTPNEMDWNFSNLSVFAGYGLFAILALLSQFVPGAWMGIGRLVDPFVHLAH